jgi:protein required for attachment to host cells
MQERIIEMKNSYCIVVVDGTRARVFTLEGGAAAPGPDLVEHEDLANPEHKLAGRDKYSTTRTGSNLNPQKGPSHGYDDHRDKEEREHERRFAQEVANHAVSLAQRQHVNHLVVVAEKRMLGLLRKALVLPAKSGIEVHELAKDLTQLTPTELHAHLAEAGLVPPRHPGTVGQSAQEV